VSRPVTTTPDRRARIFRGPLLVVFVVWALVSFVGATSLAAGHFYTLPRPPLRDLVLSAAVARLHTGASPDRWSAVHVLYAECRCSQRIVAHLVERGPLAGVDETVVLVGRSEALEASIAGAGFAIALVTPEELERDYHLRAAPLLVVADPVDEVRYLGGYTERKQGPAIRDVEIVADLRSGGAAAELPLFGCAVSRSLQTLIDPLGLKYGSKD
jgi:hypothetical protein